MKHSEKRKKDVIKLLKENRSELLSELKESFKEFGFLDKNFKWECWDGQMHCFYYEYGSKSIEISIATSDCLFPFMTGKEIVNLTGIEILQAKQYQENDDGHEILSSTKLFSRYHYIEGIL